MGINFPASPAINDLYPTPAVPGVPQYKWDGTAWLAEVQNPLQYVKRGGDTMTGLLTLSGDPDAALKAATKQYADARGMDAMSYSGIQINGSMEVGQESGSNVVSIPVNSNAYIVDGWAAYCGGQPTARASRANGGPPGFYNCLLWEATNTITPAAGDLSFVYQFIEAYRTKRLAWGTPSAQPLTLGFWLYSSVVASIPVSVKTHTADSSSYAQSYVTLVSVPAATWVYRTVTIPANTTTPIITTANQRSISISFALACGSTVQTPTPNAWVSGTYYTALGGSNMHIGGGQLYITGVVVLPGSQAPTAAQSPLIMRPYDQELATCQRYYEWCPYNMAFWSVSGGSQWNATPLPFSVTKRAIPTLGTPVVDPAMAQTVVNIANIAVGNASITGCAPSVAPTTTGMSYINGYRFYADARL
jgi:hypothetical protein